MNLSLNHIGCWKLTVKFFPRNRPDWRKPKDTFLLGAACICWYWCKRPGPYGSEVTPAPEFAGLTDTPVTAVSQFTLSLHNSVFLKLHRGCSQLHSLKNLLYTCVGNPSCTEGSPLLWKVKTSDAFLSLWVWRWSAKGNIKNMPSILILMEMQNTLLRSIIYYIECRVLAFSM